VSHPWYRTRGGTPEREVVRKYTLNLTSQAMDGARLNNSRQCNKVIHMRVFSRQSLNGLRLVRPSPVNPTRITLQWFYGNAERISL
jgi:hypothetical protein